MTKSEIETILTDLQDRVLLRYLAADQKDLLAAIHEKLARKERLSPQDEQDLQALWNCAW